MTFFRMLLFPLALFFLAGQAAAFETAFWAWQRNEPPNQSELAQLSAQSVRTLYWHVGDLENADGSWRWKSRFRLPVLPGFEVVPVLRLESRARAPFTSESMGSLGGLVSAVVGGGAKLQLDYDCPDRLLPDYAKALRAIHKIVPHLSSTALPGWINHPSALEELGKSVDELLPMFYDFEPDPMVPGAAPVPVIVPDKMQNWLRQWNHCRTPWRIGLPNFTRLTIYDPDGKPRGNLREWTWDAVVLNDALTLVRPTQLGVTLFRARGATRVANTRLREGQLLAARWPDRAALAGAMTAARGTSARGLVIFRLPDATAASGWSSRQLQHLEDRAQLTLKWQPGAQQVTLTNSGNGDLAPARQGYALEVEAGQPIFREADEGDFWHVWGEVEQEGKAHAVLIPLATRLSFSFSALRAGASLQSGLIQLAPGADFTHARFRILNSPQIEWKPVVE
ncbi:MAG: DUF3142 domain-containing protein [Chthoniobacterales bacterium]